MAETLLEGYANFLQVDGNPACDTLAKAPPGLFVLTINTRASRLRVSIAYTFMEINDA